MTVHFDLYLLCERRVCIESFRLTSFDGTSIDALHMLMLDVAGGTEGGGIGAIGELRCLGDLTQVVAQEGDVGAVSADDL